MLTVATVQEALALVLVGDGHSQDLGVETPLPRKVANMHYDVIDPGNFECCLDHRCLLVPANRERSNGHRSWSIRDSAGRHRRNWLFQLSCHDEGIAGVRGRNASRRLLPIAVQPKLG